MMKPPSTFLFLFVCLVLTGQQPKDFSLDLKTWEDRGKSLVFNDAPWFDTGWSCIDGHIFIDDDGTPYFFFNNEG